MTGIAAGLLCLGLAFIAIALIPWHPEAALRPWLRSLLWPGAALLCFLAAAAMCFGLIKA